MSLTKLDTFHRLNGHPCVAPTNSGPDGGYLTYNSIQPLLQEFAKLRKLLVNMEDNNLPAVGGAGGNLPIGSVLMWALGAGAIPAGWAIMDGVANAAGSGINMTNRFPRGNATTAGGTGGSTTYAVTGTITGGGSTSTSSSTDTFTTDTGSWSGTLSVPATLDLSLLVSDPIVIDDHPPHHHEFGVTDVPITNDAGTFDIAAAWGVSVVETTDEKDTSHADVGTAGRGHFNALDPDEYVRATFSSAGSTSSSFDVDFSDPEWNHTHSGTTDGHTHTIDTSGLGLDMDDITGVQPPYAELIFIERIT